MTPQDRAAVAALCAERAGLRVDPDKEYLLENRLGPVARREGFGALSDMLQAMRDRGDERLAWATVEAMSPAETAFFRHPPSLEQAVAQALADFAGRREGQPAKNEDAFLHRGIAARGFVRTFILADGMVVAGALLEHGLLHIDLEQPEPERQVQRIPIRTAG